MSEPMANQNDCSIFGLYLIISIFGIRFIGMILDVEKIRGFVNIPSYNRQWQEYFRNGLLLAHNEVIKNSPAQQPVSDNTMTKCLDSLHSASCSQDKSQPLATIKIEKNLYDNYSSFVPIRSKCYADRGECEKEFPYARYIYENQYRLSQSRFEADVKTNLANASKFRGAMCQKYNPFINFSQKINLYKYVLCFGTKVLTNFKDKPAVLYSLTKCKDFISGQSITKTKDCISISIQKSEAIKGETISYTMKSLYCSICFIYDCQIHLENRKNGTSFVSKKNKIQRQQHLERAIKMLNPQQVIGMSQDPCSPQCFRNLGKLCQNPNFLGVLVNKQISMSDLTKSIIEIGISMFSFQPCLIRKLLSHDVLCCQIFKYFQTELNLPLRLGNKMLSQQVQALMLQESNTKIEVSKQIIQAKIKKNTKKRQKNSVECPLYEHISICTHHDLHQPSIDLLCSSCICIKRGYCTPACLCSDFCPIMMVGCKCKKIKGASCVNGNCPCYSRGVECTQRCGKACSDSEKCCKNRQIQLGQKKNVKIGPSTISQAAGFGLFSAQPIPKDSLVTIYLGQKIDALSTQIRDQLRTNNSFYNFEQKDTYLDSRFIGNKSRFINHKGPKQANLKVRVVRSMDQIWTAFFASRDIEAGEELFFNYDGDGQIAKHHAEKYPFILPQ